MANKYDLPRPEPGKIFTWLILSDLHSLHISKEAFALAMEVFSLVPFAQRKIVLDGDILDIPFIYAKDEVFRFNLNHGNWDDYFIPEIEKEKIWFDEFYKVIRRYVLNDDDIYYVEGNHEERLRRSMFINKVPIDLRHNFELRKVLDSDARGFSVINYNDWYVLKANQMDGLHIGHGDKTGMNPIKKTFANIHGPCIFGHTHEIGIQSFTSLGNTMLGYNNPCLCEMNPKYMENRIQNWSQGFTLINQSEDLYFVNIMRIIDGKIILPTGEPLYTKQDQAG